MLLRFAVSNQDSPSVPFVCLSVCLSCLGSELVVRGEGATQTRGPSRKKLSTGTGRAGKLGRRGPSRGASGGHTGRRSHPAG